MHRRFTLIELVLIIAAVVVLVAAGLALSLLGDARERARRANCAGNLSSVGLAMLMYSGENSGHFPLTPPGNNFEPLNTGSILNDGKVYGCPSAPILRTTARLSNYRYVGSGLKDDNPLATSTRLAYDESGNHPGDNWVNAILIDGSGEGANATSRRRWTGKPTAW